MYFTSGVAGPSPVSGLQPERVSLTSMDEFRAPADGWNVAGRAYAEAPGSPLRTEAGNGTLFFDGTEAGSSSLMTEVELGDATVELNFMVEEGGCAALLLQGRYEVRLCDSLGKQSPGIHDNGGVLYGDSAGVPPPVNASRTPGVWQQVMVDYRAPRFDESGQKTANAQIEKVVLNGETIHRGLELPQISPEAALSDEAPTGPITLRGDAGRVAFRDIEYYDHKKTIELDELTYAYFEGDLESNRPLSESTPEREGAASEISASLAESGNNFALRFTGTLEVPESGTYDISAVTRGEVAMSIGDEEVLQPSPSPESPLDISLTDRPGGTIELEEGRHPFTLEYRKAQPGSAALSVFMEGPGIRRQPITSEEGKWQPMRQPPPIMVNPDDRAVVLRSHFKHRGRQVVNGVSVGDPAGVHYSLDLEHGGLLHVWRGPFLDAGPIWTNRGEDPETRMVTQPGIPESRITFSGRPPAAFLSRPNQPWPDSTDQPYQRLGYTIGENGRPTFNYRLGEMDVHERFRPTSEENGGGLIRELTFAGEDEEQRTIWVLLAEGDSIERRTAEAYSIDDELFVEIPSDIETVLRRIDGRDELLVPIRLTSEPAQVRTTITW